MRCAFRLLHIGAVMILGYRSYPLALFKLVVSIELLRQIETTDQPAPALHRLFVSSFQLA